MGKMDLQQIERIETLTAWLKTCPYTCVITSMQGSFAHVKFYLEERNDIDICAPVMENNNDN